MHLLICLLVFPPLERRLSKAGAPIFLVYPEVCRRGRGMQFLWWRPSFPVQFSARTVAVRDPTSLFQCVGVLYLLPLFLITSPFLCLLSAYYMPGTLLWSTYAISVNPHNNSMGKYA